MEAFFEETSLEKVSLPTYDKVELRDFHKRASSFGKILSYQQTLQLGLNAVQLCFNKAVSSLLMKDDKFVEQLFCVVFFKCSERRMMLEGKWNVLFGQMNPALLLRNLILILQQEFRIY